MNGRQLFVRQFRHFIACVGNPTQARAVSGRELKRVIGMSVEHDPLGSVEQGQHKLRKNIEESGRLIMETEQRVSESRLFTERVGRSIKTEQSAQS